MAGGYLHADLKLQKRVFWVTQCASVAYFNEVVWDDWRSSTVKVFVEVISLIIWYEFKGVWNWKVETLPSPICYYLGKFPMYWDYRFGRPRLPTGNYASMDFTGLTEMPPVLNFKPSSPPKWDIPFGMKPSVYNQEHLPLDVYTRADVELFHGSAGLQNLERQMSYLNRRSTTRYDCLKKNYPLCKTYKPKVFKLSG